jgi:hypothetical protein
MTPQERVRLVASLFLIGFTNTRLAYSPQMARHVVPT